MNAKNKRKLPEDASTEFVSTKIRPLIVSDGAIDKHAWECALISNLRNEIKSGNIYVKNSKRFGPFERFFISYTQWKSVREEFFRQSGLPQKGCDAAIYLSEKLNLAYDRFLETLPNNTYAQDGLLYNESDLELEEHYTDTHGYTEINFAAFAMLGKHFCPRIRKISNQRIYRIDTNRDYGVLAPLVNRKDRTIKMDWIIEQWDRMGQFYATLKNGHTTASVALKRLNSMSKRNQFYHANRELGRIGKTEFILQYMSLPPLRRRVRRGLLKVDQLHSLARDVAYAKQGRITKRDFYEIMKSCSCLTLILACIIYWQAREIGRVITECNPESDGVDTSLLEHVSPIEWENVVLYGEYVIDRNWIR